MTRLGLLLLAGLAVTALPVAAQSDLPRFEVASVKPSARSSTFFSESRFGVGTVVRFRSVSLRALIAHAYDLDVNAATEGGEDRLVGGPAALLDSPFDVEARAPEGATLVEKKAMLRSLLASRFKLRIRKETRQVLLYALTLANKAPGAGLKPSTVVCDSAEGRAIRVAPCMVARSELIGGIRIFRGAGPMPALVRQMHRELGRPVVDESGLKGNYEWSVSYRGPRQEIDAPLFEDAVRQNLGLRIVPKKGPYEVLVIDSVERPTPN
jgi:uncharacterized protein (TIGR03435 family)